MNLKECRRQCRIMNKEESIFRPVRYDKEGNLLSEFDKIELELWAEQFRSFSQVDWQRAKERFLQSVIPIEGRFIEFETSVEVKPKSKKHYATGKHYKAH